MSQDSSSSPVPSGPRLSPQELKKLCRLNDLYSTPELNDKLFLHYKGYRKIEHLEPYTGLKVLYLEGNSFSSIEGLSAQKLLNALYLQENSIKIMENLNELESLGTLNLNQNRIERIENLQGLKQLHTLLLSKNRLGLVEGAGAGENEENSLSCLKGLLDCPSLSVLDLSSNHLSHPGIIDILKQLPHLKVLYVKNNPFVQKIENYRKTMISQLEGLTYLDDRPVFEEERRLVMAWKRGGKEAEKEENDRIQQEKRDSERRSFEQFDRLREAGEKQKKIREFIKETKENDAGEKQKESADEDDGGSEDSEDEENRQDEVEEDEEEDKSPAAAEPISSHGAAKDGFISGSTEILDEKESTEGPSLIEILSGEAAARTDLEKCDIDEID